LWALDRRRTVVENLAHYAGAVMLLTITAPGAAVLPWDLSQCVHAPGVGCSGKRGCRVSPEHRAIWNLLAPRSWSALHRAVATFIRRNLSAGSPVLAYVWQYQGREVLHMHVVLALESPHDLAAALTYVERVKKTAARYGFGHQVDARRMTGESAGRYVARYIVRGLGRDAQVQEAVTAWDAPRRVAYVSPRLTQATGLTMRTLRARRYAFVLRGLVDQVGDAAAGDALRGVLAPLTAAQRSVVLQT
jgi:hypothetical protein